MPSNLGITKEYTIWCSCCDIWDQRSYAQSKQQMGNQMKSEGWKQIKGYWVCLDCVKDKDNA